MTSNIPHFPDPRPPRVDTPDDPPHPDLADLTKPTRARLRDGFMAYVTMLEDANEMLAANGEELTRVITVLRSDIDILRETNERTQEEVLGLRQEIAALRQEAADPIHDVAASVMRLDLVRIGSRLERSARDISRLLAMLNREPAPETAPNPRPDNGKGSGTRHTTDT